MAENAILKHQSLTILQQIEELKNWHKQQQSKLKSDSSSQATNVAEDRYDVLKVNEKNENDANVVKLKHNNPIHPQNIDETPIKVANPNFIDYIENNINFDEKQENQTDSNRERPKFKFLKRGEGIARFRMGPQKPSKYGKGNNRSLKLSSNTAKSGEKYLHTNEEDRLPLISKEINDDYKYQSAPKSNPEIPNLDPPDVKLDFKNWKSIFKSGQAEKILERAIENNQLEIFQPNSSIDSSTASIMEKLIAVGRKHLKEREELRVFETMEQHVMDSSFCSTSSYVAKLMEHAVISTPVKNSPQSRTLTQTTVQNQGMTIQKDNLGMEGLEDTERTKSIPVGKWDTIEQTSQPENQNTDDLEQSLHVRFAEEIDYKSFIEYSKSFNSANQTVKESDNQFDESEEWKEDSGDESCCSECKTAYSSSDEDVKAISPPSTPPLLKQNQKNDPEAKTTQASLTKLNVADLVSSVTQAAAHGSSGMNIFPPLLSAKLKELEDEIEIFRAENKKLKTIREKLEKEHKQFQLEKKKYLKEIEEEKKKNAAQLEEEKQKLSKEKLIFEKYSKSLIKNPTKEERKEMQALREQLSEMKEELNKKESRWGAAQARVRNQVKLLEVDNKKLRDEVEMLRKQSKSLEILTRKKKSKSFNNTKLIHAINDHISNMGLEDNISEGLHGYFKQLNTAQINQIPIEEVDPKSLNMVKVIREDMPSDMKKAVNNQKASDGKNTTDNIGSRAEVSTELGLSDKATISTKQNCVLQEKDCQSKSTNSVEVLNSDPVKESVNEDGSIERAYPDGRREIRYKNGNVKKIDPFLGNEKTIYFNGDVKEIVKDGTVKYYFSESRIWHTTLPDGLEVLDFPNGQVEKRHTDGTIEVIYPNNSKKITFPNGVEEIYYADGTTLKIDGDKRKVLLLPNGQREIHTEEFIRREYPDGTVKVVYPDGTTETVYSNGRVRLKDKHGNLVMDSGTLGN